MSLTRQLAIRNLHGLSYLTNVNINSEIKNQLVMSFFKQLNVSKLSQIKDKIRQIISLEFSSKYECVGLSRGWVECEGSCFSGLEELIIEELSSTAYNLRVLYNSLIPQLFDELEIGLTGSLTGLWADDSQNITIERLGRQSNSRLILGLGPSGCGKTYWAKTLIEAFSRNESFPNVFLSIDGGIYRESSIVYQYIIEVMKEFCIAGFNNLVSTSILNRSLFDSNTIKHSMVSFLKSQQVSISLYIPETLSDCGDKRVKTCSSKYMPYIDITGDNDWITVVIYQHKYPEDCKYPSGYNCVGCAPSGKAREMVEGKKYSDRMYDHSMKEAIAVLQSESNGGKYIIHNTGNKNKSIIDDFTMSYSPDRDSSLALLHNVTDRYIMFSHSDLQEKNINKFNYRNTRKRR
jgi:hypothetical protein